MIHARLLAALTCSAAVIALAPGPARAQVYDWEKNASYRYRVWIPEDMDFVYGFYVTFNSSGDDNRQLAERLSWQGWTRTYGFGIIGTDIEDPGDPDSLLEAMAAVAEISGHPEVEHAPLLLEGVSLGGYLAMEFAAAHPERTIAYLSGASRQLVPVTGNEAFERVPGLYYLGETDGDPLERSDDLLAIRTAGALLGYWIQWGFDHCRCYGNKVGWQFLDDVVRLRYPTNQDPRGGPVQLIDIPDDYGWLADPDSWTEGIARIYPYADYPGDPSTAFWLPTADMAFIYRAHASQTAPLSFPVPNPDVDWESASVGEEVTLTIDVGGLEGVASVDVYNGAERIATLTAPPYETTWTVPEPGIHGINAVATVTGGEQRTGLIVPFLVEGQGVPGGGGLEDPDLRPDAGPGPGGGDAGPGGDSDGGAGGDGMPGGGCCRTSGSSPGAGTWLLALGVLALVRRRRARG